jgi:hypothetical protein
MDLTEEIIFVYAILVKIHSLCFVDLLHVSAFVCLSFKNSCCFNFKVTAGLFGKLSE